jgi:hypothetical protein
MVAINGIRSISGVIPYSYMGGSQQIEWDYTVTKYDTDKR